LLTKLVVLIAASTAGDLPDVQLIKTPVNQGWNFVRSCFVMHINTGVITFIIRRLGHAGFTQTFE